MAATNSRSSRSSGQARSTPIGITDTRHVNVVETLTVGAAVLQAPEAINQLLEIGERVHKYFKDVDPVVCQVLDSGMIGESYQVVMRLTNQTLHGVYLETVALAKPDVKSIDFLLPASKKEPGMTFGNSQDSPAARQGAAATPTYTPILIPPAGTLLFGIQFRMPKESGEPPQSGEFIFQIARLDQKQTKPRPVSFLMRT